MSSDFVPVSSRGVVLAWTKCPINTVVRGIFHDQRRGPYGSDLADLALTADVQMMDGHVFLAGEDVSLPVNVVLDRELSRVRRGAEIEIEHLGMREPSKPGAKAFRDFQVRARKTDHRPRATDREIVDDAPVRTDADRPGDLDDGDVPF